MIVRYVRERGYKGNGKDPHVTLGKNYYALGITFNPAPYPPEVSIQCDSDGILFDLTPGLFELRFFEIIEPRIPSGWAFTYDGCGYFSLSPHEFDADFWGLFHNGDKEAEKVYDQVVKRIKRFHKQIGWPSDIQSISSIDQLKK